MTGRGMFREASRANAQGVAAACLGLLLLGGTLSWQLLRSGPAFPPHSGMATETQTDVADASASGERSAAPRVAFQPTLGTAPQALPPTPIDINRADGEALEALPGVGPALALRIVAYRESHGQFRRVEELMGVPGIGAKRYARLQGYVRVESP